MAAGGANPVSNPNKSVIEARKRIIKAIDSMYELLEVGVETQTSYKAIAHAIEAPEHVMANISTWMKEQGFLIVRYQGKINAGKASFWTLTAPKEEVLARLKEVPISRRTAKTEPEPEPVAVPEPKPEPESKIAIAPERSTEVVRAIAGPEPENPFVVLRALRKDESAALVEAARQYIDRAKLVETKLAELEAAGIHIDMSAVKFDKDERLETVALTLPYIGRLETEIHNYVNQIEALRRKVVDYDAMKRNYETLKRRFERDIAARVANGS